MRTETFRYDSADYLDSNDAIAGYAQEMADDGDPAVVGIAIDVVIRARGLNALAESTGIPRRALVEALSGEDPNGAEVLRSALVSTASRASAQAAE